MNSVATAELEAAWRTGAFLDGRDSGGRRHVDADLIREFCIRRRSEVDPRGIQIRDAVITNTLDLANVDVPFPLRFVECEFDAPPIMEGARLFDLALAGCARLPGLLANGLTVFRDIDLSGSTFTGAHWTSASTSMPAAIWLCESTIGGRMRCAGTIIRPEGGRAIHADHLQVGGTVKLLDGFAAHGEVRLIGAQIDGSFDMSGILVESPTDHALNLRHAVISGAVLLVDDAHGRRPVIRGGIDLRSTRVSGQLHIRNASLVKPELDTVPGHEEPSRHDSTVISAARLAVGADLSIAGDTEITGTLDLFASNLSGLQVGPGCRLIAPGRTALDLNSAEIGSGLQVGDGAQILGTIRLVGARIHGNLRLEGVTLRDPEGPSLIKADAVTVDGNVELARANASGGRLKFWRATIHGGLDATDAELTNRSECTLRLHQSTVGGSVRLVDGFTSHGYVS